MFVITRIGDGLGNTVVGIEFKARLLTTNTNL